MYDCDVFSCLFVGGSSGGNLDLRKTALFDGERVLTGHTLITLAKVAPGKRYRVMNKQNFRKIGPAFIVVDAVTDRRTVSAILDTEANESRAIRHSLVQSFADKGREP